MKRPFKRKSTKLLVYYGNQDITKLHLIFDWESLNLITALPKQAEDRLMPFSKLCWTTSFAWH